MSKASREIIKHYKKKCARKKSIKFRQVRVNEIEMISLAFYYSRARQQTKKRQLIDHQLSFSFSCAQDKTRTCTNAIVHYPLKVACLPIPPPAREKVPRTGLEPACLSTHAPETCASTNSATWAKNSGAKVDIFI